MPADGCHRRLAGQVIQAENSIKFAAILDIVLHQRQGDLILAFTADFIHDFKTLISRDGVLKALDSAPARYGCFMFQDQDSAGFLFFHHIFTDGIAGPVIVRHNGAVCQALLFHFRVYDNDLYAHIPGPLEDVTETDERDRGHDQGADAHIQHAVDLLRLPFHIQAGIAQDHQISFPLHADTDLLVQDIIELIIHSHIAGADQT